MSRLVYAGAQFSAFGHNQSGDLTAISCSVEINFEGFENIAYSRRG
jgi:hypothetical protein